MQVENNNKKSFCFCYLLPAIVFIVIVLDFISKQFVLQNLYFNEPIIFIENFWQWRLVFNPGAAFSFLADAGGWQKYFFMIITIFISVYIIFLLFKEYNKKLQSIGLSFVLGGAVGNFIDRILYGAVVDFIDIHYYDKFYYPTFNIADCAVCFGIFLVMISIFKENKNK